MMNEEMLNKRYLTDGENSIDDMFRRVAEHVGKSPSWQGAYYQLMSSKRFLPNSPTLMNAGTELGQLSACFVLPVEDSMNSIFGTLRDAALVWKSGGGTGFSFSNIRSKGAPVWTTGGKATGPMSFLDIYNEAAGTVEQGGKRPGANMAVLRVDHPDINAFLDAKQADEDRLSNFNLSVGITNDFMRRVEDDVRQPLRDPHTGELKHSPRARSLWEKIAACAWNSGEPGLVFLDRLNADNPFTPGDRFRATNPCGEQPLLPYESCNLGSINLAEHVLDGDINYARLIYTARVGVRFLDDVIDANQFPLPEIREKTLATRRVGLGVMGWHETLNRVGLSYDDPEAVQLADRVMSCINEAAYLMSEDLVHKQGREPFPRWEEAELVTARRNLTLTTIAPTGSISQIADTTPSIEPVWALEYEASGSSRKFEWADENTRTALDLSPETHVRMQAAFQRHTDSAVSKTVNLPNEATVADVQQAYKLAWELGCKGVTVYRDGSRSEQANNCPECENVLGDDE